MDKDLLQRYFFLGLLFVVSVLVFFVFLPFFEVIVLSGIFAITLNPVYLKINKFLGGRKRLSAILVIILFTLLVVGPFSLLATQVLDESRDLYTQLTSGGEIDYISKVTLAIETPIQKFYPAFTLDIEGYARFFTDFISGRLSSIISGVINFFVSLILIFISLYFLLKDGHEFKKVLVSLSPLSDEYDEKIFLKIKNTIGATVKGVILVAIVQGLLAGLGMFVFGVPNPALWGSVSAVAALVPGLGTALVFIPVIAYMVIIGNLPYAIGLALWGIIIVGLVDNFLVPYLYSRGVQIHELIMLFAVFGGLVIFGPIGFILGPIVISLFFALIDIYQSIILKNKS